MAIVKRSVLIQLFPAFKGCCLHKCISTCQGESLHLQQQEKKNSTSRLRLPQILFLKVHLKLSES